MVQAVREPCLKKFALPGVLKLRCSEGVGPGEPTIEAGVVESSHPPRVECVEQAQVGAMVGGAEGRMCLELSAGKHGMAGCLMPAQGEERRLVPAASVQAVAEDRAARTKGGRVVLDLSDPGASGTSEEACLGDSAHRSPMSGMVEDLVLCPEGGVDAECESFDLTVALVAVPRCSMGRWSVLLQRRGEVVLSRVVSEDELERNTTRIQAFGWCGYLALKWAGRCASGVGGAGLDLRQPCGRRSLSVFLAGLLQGCTNDRVRAKLQRVKAHLEVAADPWRLDGVHGFRGTQSFLIGTP